MAVLKARVLQASYPDICRKLLKEEDILRKSLEDILKIAQKVVSQREEDQKKEVINLMVQTVHEVNRATVQSSPRYPLTPTPSPYPPSYPYPHPPPGTPAPVPSAPYPHLLPCPSYSSALRPSWRLPFLTTPRRLYCYTPFCSSPSFLPMAC